MNNVVTSRRHTPISRSCEHHPSIECVAWRPRGKAHPLPCTSCSRREPNSANGFLLQTPQKLVGRGSFRHSTALHRGFTTMKKRIPKITSVRPETWSVGAFGLLRSRAGVRLAAKQEGVREGRSHIVHATTTDRPTCVPRPCRFCRLLGVDTSLGNLVPPALAEVAVAATQRNNATYCATTPPPSTPPQSPRLFFAQPTVQDVPTNATKWWLLLCPTKEPSRRAKPRLPICWGRPRILPPQLRPILVASLD